MCLVFTLCWLEVWAWTTSSFLCLFLSFRDNNCNFRRCRSYVQSFKYLFAEYTFFGDILKYNCITLFSRATMHISVYSGYGLIPRKRECQPWHARPSHLAATQLVLFKAYTKFRAAFFCSKKWSKCDLCASVWQQYLSSFVVFLKDVQRFAQGHGIPFVEVSAFTGMNVHNLFSKIGTFTLSELMNMLYWPNVMSRWLDIAKFVLSRSVETHTKKQPRSQAKRRGDEVEKMRDQHSSILTEQAWKIRDILYSEKRDQRGKFGAGESGSQSEWGFASSCSLADSRNTGSIFAQLVAQHCCIASWKALLPVLPPSLPTCHATNFDVVSCGNMLRK